MRILVDIGHPAHVHYFKNSLKILTEHSHEILISARDRGPIFEILTSSNLAFFSRGRGSKSILGKFFNIPLIDWKIYLRALKFRPDLLMGFASPYIAHVSRLINKPSIIFDDTEHAKLNHILYYRFADTIITPKSFFKNFWNKQIRVDSFMELGALHPRYFKTARCADTALGINDGKRCFLLRFVSWDANHDVGFRGLSLGEKLEVINHLEKYGRVFISSESKLPDSLEKYKLKIPPADIHSVMSLCSLLVTEGATMASEAAMLGIPSIYINPLDAGTLREQERYGLLFGFRDFTGVLEKIEELLVMPDLKEEWQRRRHKMLSEKIDLTAFIVWFIENYPQSFETMRSQPEFQYSFRQGYPEVDQDRTYSGIG